MPAPEEDVMRVFLIGAACVVSCAGPAFAQGERAYVNVGGGIATSADATSGDVLGGAGVARLTPAAAFTYSSGTLPGTTPALGDDVTSQLVSLGAFTQRRRPTRSCSRSAAACSCRSRRASAST